MELKIVSNSKDISACDAERRLLEEGIILVYSNLEIIGFVTHYNEWILETVTITSKTNTLEDLIEKFPEYTFKLKIE
jgi:hypothetical protein